MAVKSSALMFSSSEIKKGLSDPHYSTYLSFEGCLYINTDDYRLFPSSKNSHFGNEAKCKTFLVKMSLHETKSFS